MKKSAALFVSLLLLPFALQTVYGEVSSDGLLAGITQKVGKSMLKSAVNSGDLSRVQELFKKGVKINSEETLDLFATVCEQDNDRMAALLVEKGLDPKTNTDKIWRAILNADAGKVARVMLAKGLPVNEGVIPCAQGFSWRNPVISNPLFAAIRMDKPSVANALLASGADLDVRTIGKHRYTALFEAIINKREAIAIAIIRECARRGRQDILDMPDEMTKRTPLVFVTIPTEFHPVIAKSLIANGANVNGAGHDGPTPIMYMLVNLNRDGNLKNQKAIEQDKEIIQLLLDNGAGDALSDEYKEFIDREMKETFL